MRLINADELKNVFEGYSYEENPNPHLPLDMVKKDIDDVPTVEAKEVVHGEWKTENGVLFPVYRCSECNCATALGKTKFCPNCGCMMEK